MNPIKEESKIYGNLYIQFGKWLLIAFVTGAIGGFIGYLFNISVTGATNLRSNHPWLIFLLPIGGLIIAFQYKIAKVEQRNTNAIIDSIHFGDKVPFLLFPSIFIGTLITHICGGSAGREGAALQIGGSLGYNIGTLFHLDEKDLRLATLCGMSAVFSALFGTPLTATIFALEVISVGVFYYSGFVPCLVSSLVAYWITRVFHLPATSFTILMAPLSIDYMWRVAILGIICAIMSAVFCIAMHSSEYFISKLIPSTYLKIFIGGTVIVLLTLILNTTDYNGVGMNVIEDAITLGTAKPAAFFWKIIFTAITLSCGFKGGEVVPTFFIGATLGCVVGPLLGLPAGFSAGIALTAVFCGAVNCPIASLVMAIELFGSSELIYFAIAIGISYVLSGYFGLYHSQKIIYSKIKAEYINIDAK